MERVPKYIKQLDRHSCGPVAILNLLEWASSKAELEMSDLIQACKCQFGDTYFEPFYKSIHNVCTKTNIVLEQIIFKPTDDQIYAHLDKGGAIILLFHWKDDNGSGEHYSLLLKDKPNESSIFPPTSASSSMVMPSSSKRRLICIINSDNPKTNRPIIENINNRELRNYIKPYDYKINNARFTDAIDCIFPKAFFFSLQPTMKSNKRKR